MIDSSTLKGDESNDGVGLSRIAMVDFIFFSKEKLSNIQIAQIDLTF
jgi:hypothetical protein